MKESSTSSLLRPEEIEDVYHFLYFHWFGHVLLFAGSLIAAWVTDNNLITGAAVLVFCGSGLMMALADALPPYWERKRLYAVKYGLFMLFSAFLVAGWLATDHTGHYLYTAAGMLIYAASIIPFSQVKNDI